MCVLLGVVAAILIILVECCCYRYKVFGENRLIKPFVKWTSSIWFTAAGKPWFRHQTFHGRKKTKQFLFLFAHYAIFNSWFKCYNRYFETIFSISVFNAFYHSLYIQKIFYFYEGHIVRESNTILKEWTIPNDKIYWFMQNFDHKKKQTDAAVFFRQQQCVRIRAINLWIYDILMCRVLVGV